MTLDGVIAVILRYFSEFGYLPDVLRKSSRSLSHLLMSSCFVSVSNLTLESVQYGGLKYEYMWMICVQG